MSSDLQEPRERPQPTADEDDITLLDLVILFAKHKKLILGMTLGAAVLSTGVAWLLPDVFTATARLLPPEQKQSSAAMLLGQFGGLTGLAGSSLGIGNPSDLYVGMLRSRTIADNIIRRFGLQKLYGERTLVGTRRALAKATSITAGKDGLISIEFDDTDPKRAADIANAYSEELDMLTQSLAVTEAAQRRLFFERQLKQAKADLTNAEIALKVTQEKTGLIKLDDQGRAIIEAVASLRGQIAAKEVELRSMETFATEQNADYIRVREQLTGLRAELAKLQQSKNVKDANVLMPTGNVPEAGLEYMRKLRDVKYYEAIFEVLAKQFEAAKIDEAKESAIVQVMDRAVPPDEPSKPRRLLIVIGTTAISVLVALLLALTLETRKRMTQNSKYAARLAASR